MITIHSSLILRPAHERGQANHGWIESRHTFSFADYYDPAWMSYRCLRVINDDWVAPGKGFATHPHRDMEIISYVLSGTLEHKDSMGHNSRLQSGQFQHMSAGSGIFHSEFNPSPDQPLHFLQIWIQPARLSLTPRYAEKSARHLPTGALHLIASQSGRADSLAIQQDADLWLAKLAAGDSVTHRLAADRHAWVHVATGAVTVNGADLAAGDAVALSGEAVLTLTAPDPAEVLLFDLS